MILEDLPAEVDPDYYRAQNADLASLDDEAAVRHFREHGAREGRVSSIATRREGFISAVIAREQGRLIEVGPYNRPVVTGRSVRYLDMWTHDQLRGRIQTEGGAIRDLPQIHYVGTLDAAPRSFDAAVASRSIGHHPDLIRHLQAVGRALIDGGRYYLIVPDQRYGGAASLPLATAAAVIAAHRAGHERHTLETLVAHRALRLSEDPLARWAGHNDPFPLEDRARAIEDAIAEHEQARGYIDAEAWHFTPESFRDLFAMLHRLGLSPFVPVRVWTTPLYGDEFCAVLEKPA